MANDKGRYAVRHIQVEATPDQSSVYSIGTRGMMISGRFAKHMPTSRENRDWSLAWRQTSNYSQGQGHRF
jgi:hypothetical protein